MSILAQIEGGASMFIEGPLAVRKSESGFVIHTAMPELFNQFAQTDPQKPITFTRQPSGFSIEYGDGNRPLYSEQVTVQRPIEVVIYQVTGKAGK